ANLWGRVVLDDLDYQRRHASQMLAYGSSKLMNILFARGIAERWKADGIVAAAVHPGTVATSFGRESRMAGLLYRSPLRRLALSSPEQGAAPLIALVRRGADPNINGVYFHRFHAHGIANRQARDQTLIDGLWERSRQLAGVPSTDPN
ncbi:MAG TPA: hypothetical protein VFQ88_01055, partial [Nevskiaceae bacterium]|nr:hypothetical protein [Nevskiaceae bacterium]